MCDIHPLRTPGDIPIYKPSRHHIDRVIEAFFSACRSVGCYEREPSIRSSSGLDPSVRFIGSHISVFLPRMVRRELPPNGIAMWQDCIRTRALTSMKRLGRLDSEWGTYFVSLGAVLPDSNEKQACALLHRCLTQLGVSHVAVSCLSSDTRLSNMSRLNFTGWLLHEDTEQAPFRHKVGLDHVRGKNINIAISMNGMKYEPVGNIIVYHNCLDPCGIEVALGTTTVVKVLRRLNHVLDAFPLPALDNFGEPEVVRCWKDVAVTSLHMLREGLPVAGQHNRSRLLRSYISIFRKSPITQQLGVDGVRAVLLEYLADYYTSTYTLTPSLTHQELLDNLVT